MYIIEILLKSKPVGCFKFLTNNHCNCNNEILKRNRPIILYIIYFSANLTTVDGVVSYYRTFPSIARNNSIADSRRSTCSEIPPPSYQDLFPQSSTTSISNIPKDQSQQQQSQIPEEQHQEDQQNQSLAPQNQSQAQQDQPPQHQDQPEHILK